MKMHELREMSADELAAKDAELRDQLFKLKFQKSLGQLDSPMKLKIVKRDIARIQTLLRDLRNRTE
jgi:large subunit ribosomal protein L29